MSYRLLCCQKTLNTMNFVLKNCCVQISKIATNKKNSGGTLFQIGELSKLGRLK